MQFPLILAASPDAYSAPLFALFLAFAIAAVIWLIIWLLSSGEVEGNGEKVRETEAGKPAEKAEPAPEPVEEKGEADPAPPAEVKADSAPAADLPGGN